MNQEELDIKAYLKVLKKRRWTVISVFLSVLLTVTAATFMMTPMYKASAQVYIDQGNTSQYTPLQQAQDPIDASSYLQTQLGILKSVTVARKVAKYLRLDQNKGQYISEGPLQSLLRFFGVAHENLKADDDQAARNIQGKLQVAVVKDSNLVTVSYEDSDPVLAARVVNATVRAFVEQNLEMKVAPAKEAMSWLNDRLGEIKERMNQSSNQLQDFKQQKNLISTGNNQSNLSLQSLSELNTQVLDAVAKRYDAEIKYQQVQHLAKKPGGMMTLPAVMNDSVVQGLRVQQSALNTEIAEKSKKYRDNHPEMVKLRNEMGSLQKQLDNEVNLVVAGLKNNYDEALRSEQTLKKALVEQKAEAMSYERRTNQYNIMNEDVDASRQVYDMILKKFQESDVMGSISMSSVQVLDPADPPKAPSSPRKTLNMLMGVVLGLFSGIGFAFLVEYLDNTYKSLEELEEHLKLPLLGAVPTNKLLKDLKNGRKALTGLQPTKSPYSESFRSIRGNILLTTGDMVPKVIQICSSVHSEGKTTSCIALAAAMASAGEKVLVIDSDMRKPRLHRYLNLPNTSGLSTLLAHQTDLESIIRKSDLGFHIITSGPLSPNPSELLGSRLMRELIAGIREEYDRVIIDCPPAIGIVDSSFLGQFTDGIILVIRSGKTPKDLVVKTKKNFGATKARIIGVILNDVSVRSEVYSYYNYNYYYSEKKVGE
ncbi:MAG: polysaccharide biosynthesis tyrosine autokinase [Nitrospirota bacterium]